MAGIEDEKAKELVKELQEIADEKGISLQKLFGVVLDTKNHAKETIENPYSDFGNPDEDEKRKIDSWSDEYRENVRGKIEFGVDTQKGPATILTLPNGKKLTFDKTPIGDSDTKPRNWDEAMAFAEDNNRTLPSEDDFYKLFEGFHGNQYELKGILNIAHNYYCSSTSFANYSYRAWYGNFNSGLVHYSFKDTTILYTICTHN